MKICSPIGGNMGSLSMGSQSLSFGACGYNGRCLANASGREGECLR